MKTSLIFAIVISIISFLLSAMVDLVIGDRAVKVEDNLIIAGVFGVSVFVVDKLLNKESKN